MHTVIVNNYNIIPISEVCRALWSPNEPFIDMLFEGCNKKDNGVNEIWAQLTRFLPQEVAKQSPNCVRETAVTTLKH